MKALFSLTCVLLCITATFAQDARVRMPTQVTTMFTPYDAEEAESAVVRMIDGAEDSIQMACYAFTDQKVMDALIRAKSRGVKVRIIMDKSQASGAHQALMVKKIIKSGIDLTIGHSPVHSQLLHSKFIVVDNTFTEEGSWNYTGQTACEQSNTLNFSNDPERAKQLTVFWLELYTDIRAAKK